MSEDETFGSDIDYDEELETALQTAESQALPASEHAKGQLPLTVDDIEDVPMMLSSPFEQFRKKGWLSVSDLVGTVWCEVQYDYRLRTLPFLPPAQRPAVITSEKGKEIVVDKVKVEGKERILRRGEKIHKRLEREIHPQEILVTATTREDIWGLRFLNMFSSLEALLTLGKCREMPVVGFVKGVLVMGIIDELTRKPLDPVDGKPKPETRSARQTALTSFFSPSKPRPSVPQPRTRTHKVYVSDSKTRASGTLPRESDTLAGRLQCMVYKQLLDGMLLGADALGEAEVGTDDDAMCIDVTGQSRTPALSFAQVFAHVRVDSRAAFSESFVAQSRLIITGNGLRWGAAEARCLDDMLRVWRLYVEGLGLGTIDIPPATSKSPTNANGKVKGKEQVEKDDNAGRTEKRLELVYRRAAPRKQKQRGEKRRKGKRRKGRRSAAGDIAPDESRHPPGEETDHQAVGGDGDAPLMGRSGSPILPAKDAEFSIQLSADDEEQAMQLAIAASLLPTPSISMLSVRPDPPEPPITIHDMKGTHRHADHLSDRTSDEEKEEDELAWAVEMSLAGQDPIDGDGTAVVIPLSQRSEVAGPAEPPLIDSNGSDTEAPTPNDNGKRSSSPSPSPPGRQTTSGSIIGRHRFQHDPVLLAMHLESVLHFWMGRREPTGVTIEQANRCGWCEFEDGCEWRAKKAEEAWEKARARMARAS